MTSRNSFNSLYATSSTGTGPGVEELLDFGSHIRPGDSGGPAQCADPNDQCPVDACDSSDPDCVVLLAGPGGPAVSGDNCGPGSKPIGAPLGPQDASGKTERIIDIKEIFNDYTAARTAVGYVYISDQGHSYVQPNITFGVGAGVLVTGSVSLIEPPWVPIGNLTASNLSDALNRAFDAARKAGFSVNPGGYNILVSGKVGQAPCFSQPHSSTWT